MKSNSKVPRWEVGFCPGLPWLVSVGIVCLVLGCAPKQTPTRGGSTEGPKLGEGGKSLKLAVIPKGTTHEFWKSIHAGALKAQQELKEKGREVEILWKGPLKEDDRNEQVSIVETFRTQKVDGIVLAPLDAKALVRPSEEAIDAGIPVVVIDSDLASEKYASFVATDNKKGGELASDRLSELLGGKGRVLVMRYQVGSASTENREAGFLEGLKKSSGITVVSSNKYAGPTRETAYKTAQNLLNRFGSQVEGVFTPNESSTAGMRKALEDTKLLGKVKFVGFDASSDLIEGLKNRDIQGLVVQNPLNMGYLGVITMVDVLDKKPVDKRVDTGVAMVTPENMDTPEMKELLNPPLDRYLK
ncbi:MAG: substrate-binding domain-containing protein [Armatimonadetes bacterium]|nr:substrate-binding domain-containing protein [Armatimonadota bacterium]